MPDSDLLGTLFGSPDASAVFSDQARLQGMLDFEAALAEAEAQAGVIPSSAAPVITAQCRAELFDCADLAKATASAGNPAIPVVKRLTALVGRTDPDAARYVHWGATSQDAMDTGLVLQLRTFLALLEADVARLAAALAHISEAHKTTVLAGRTWLQHALPVTLGLKAAGWLDAIERHKDRITAAGKRTLALQFGGAAGTLASLGDRGLTVADLLARDLGLALPPLSWHAHRDRIAELATVLGLLVGTLGKVARDVSLLMQTEIGEAFEARGEGRGGSSTMPQKRNPVAASVILAAAARAPGLVATLLGAMVQEHERGLGGWQAEWEALPALCVLTAGAIRHTAEMIAGMEVDASRMQANLALTHGQILAEAVTMVLASRIGRLAAHELVARACKDASASGKDLKTVIADDPDVRKHLSPDELDQAFDFRNYLGLAATFVDRVLEARRSRCT